MGAEPFPQVESMRAKLFLNDKPINGRARARCLGFGFLNLQGFSRLIKFGFINMEHVFNFMQHQTSQVISLIKHHVFTNL